MYGASENSGASSALGPIKNSPGKPINEETQVRPFTDRAKSVPAASHILIEAKLAMFPEMQKQRKGLPPATWLMLFRDPPSSFFSLKQKY
jgi:hypothetical protein